MQIITKFANGSQSNCKQLKHLIDYVTNPLKTCSDLIYCNGLFVNNAFDNMMLIKQLSSQTDGRQYIHWITSFHPDDNISSELAHQLGRQFASGFNDFQWLMATHTDRNHIHNHYIMNSVNSVTGNKFSQSKGDLEKLKKYINSLYTQSILFDCSIPDIYEEENNMYYDEDEYYEDDLFEITEKNDKNEIAELRKEIQVLNQGITVMVKCMSGFTQMCNPQTLSNAISYEVDRQLNQRLGALPSPDQKHMEE